MCPACRKAQSKTLIKATVKKRERPGRQTEEPSECCGLCLAPTCLKAFHKCVVQRWGSDPAFLWWLSTTLNRGVSKPFCAAGYVERCLVGHPSSPACRGQTALPGEHSGEHSAHRAGEKEPEEPVPCESGGQTSERGSSAALQTKSKVPYKFPTWKLAPAQRLSRGRRWLVGLPWGCCSWCGAGACWG